MKRLLLLLFLLAACTPNAAYPPPDVLDAEYTACDAPEDCVVLELGCCDACNGGEARSVNSEHEDTVRTLYTQSCVFVDGCTEIGCNDWETTCEDNVCGLQRTTF